MQHDVRRLDRLISDISDASRLDAEMARVDSAPVDVAQLVRAVVSMLADSPRSRGVALKLTIEPGPDGGAAGLFRAWATIRGWRRWSPISSTTPARSREPGGEVRIALRRAGDEGERVEIVVEDDGPGIPDHALERIFERFYTDRPSEGFGQNSGLGLSISRQIVQAHSAAGCGRRTGRCRRAPPPPWRGRGRQRRHGAGARFVVEPAGLPMSGAVHASAVLVGERGVLIRGASGAGKSLMALALVERVRRDGGFAALVADDRVWLEAVARPAASRAARRSWRACASAAAQGLVEAPHEPQRGAAADRRSRRARRRAAAAHAGARPIYTRRSAGVALPRLRIDLSPGLDDGVSAVMAALARIEGSTMAKKRRNERGFRLIIAPQRTKMRLLRRWSGLLAGLSGHDR